MNMSDFLKRGMSLVLMTDFGMQWSFFILSAKLRSEKFYDLIGSISHVTVAAISLLANNQQDNLLSRVQLGVLHYGRRDWAPSSSIASYETEAIGGLIKLSTTTRLYLPHGQSKASGYF